MTTSPVTTPTTSSRIRPSSPVSTFVAPPLPFQVTMKQLVIQDLTKRCNDTNNRLKEFSALYDVVKNERNKYVNLIQASHQALAEMKEKIKILHNEARGLCLGDWLAREKGQLFDLVNLSSHNSDITGNFSNLEICHLLNYLTGK